jgi:hypothetical protein
MVSKPEGQGESSEKRKPPNRRPIIIRIFRSLKRHEHRRRRRAQQEKSDRDLIMARWTRRVGIFTAALVAVGVVTGVIFWNQLNVMQGQLGEMQSASIDMKNSIDATNRLADAAVRSNIEVHRLVDEAKRSADNAIKTAERQLRAYVGILGKIFLACPLCETADIDKPAKPSFNDFFSNTISFEIQNGGLTPAYNVIFEDSYQAVVLVKDCPRILVIPSTHLLRLPALGFHRTELLV